MEKKIKIAAVVGPTACGKTSVSVEVARLCGGEIVCCDSMQIYRGMSVGTAAPLESEMNGVPHRLFGCVDPKMPYSCADYAAAADGAVADISSRGALPVLVGGTGLYLDSVLLGCGDSAAAPDDAFREEMRRIADEQGAEELHRRLSELDPEAALTIHPNNVRRVIRALEICRACGSKSEYDRAARNGLRYDAKVVGLRFSNRAELYRRIDRRVDLMLAAGLVDETRRLYEDGVFEVNSTAAQAIGYKELLPFIRGEAPLCDCTEKLKTATRHYAKRQMTWFASKPYISWIDCHGIEDEKTFEKIVKNTLSLFNNI